LGLEALAESLTGERVALPGYELLFSDTAGVLQWLAQSGWGVERITAFRQARETAGERWPLPVSPAAYAGLGAAQFIAARTALLTRLAVTAAKVRDAATPLDADDKRLLEEVPPHHGSVG
ncbi:MAG: hypothetical protein LBC29_07135, partial [Propionibacteriaceae bacterium]|nr:hypothetical protein [Propionibacteriaceae bacterium]